MGGRGTTVDYGNLSQLTDIKKGQLKTFAQLPKDQGSFAGYDRRMGINLVPDNTIELRYMASGITTPDIKKNQQWVQAVFDFTKSVKARDAMKGAFTDAGYFLGFLEDQDYPELDSFIANLFPTAKHLEKT
jgi:hypothetical protein